MDPYDHGVVAGLGCYHFSETLLELSNFIGIPPPEFRGRRVYKEYDLEKWEIQTIIQGREEDPEHPTMDYTIAYIDWSYGVEIAMQGAVARIFHKHHHRFSSTTPYYLFGEHNESGRTMDQRITESPSIYWTYMTEREYNTVNMEDMLKKQILLMDKFWEAMDITSQRIITAESCLLVLDDKRTKLKNENEALKKKLDEYEAKAQAEEDPEELTLYNTDGEEITIDD
jgi:hypothetical protein